MLFCKLVTITTKTLFHKKQGTITSPMQFTNQLLLLYLLIKTNIHTSLKPIYDLLRSQTAAHNTLAYLLLQSQFKLSQREAFLRVYNFQRQLWQHDSKEWEFEINGWIFRSYICLELVCCFGDPEEYEYILVVQVENKSVSSTKRQVLKKAGLTSNNRLPLRKHEREIRNSFLELFSNFT